MKKLIFLFLCAATCGFAALPPAWQGVREIQALLSNPELSHYLNSGDAINSIQRNEHGWEIVTNHSKIDVEVSPLAQDHPGPQPFQIKFKASSLND